MTKRPMTTAMMTVVIEMLRKRRRRLRTLIREES
jgi:hypothetical protein